ncbi:hypothetical protein KM043_000877 [Ampulex compressa]|nr:hypothetical protein KM043_000877 [Ampulex compressa]
MLVFTDEQVTVHPHLRTTRGSHPRTEPASRGTFESAKRNPRKERIGSRARAGFRANLEFEASTWTGVSTWENGEARGRACVSKSGARRTTHVRGCPVSLAPFRHTFKPARPRCKWCADAGERRRPAILMDSARMGGLHSGCLTPESSSA